MDDILTGSATCEQQLAVLDQILERLQRCGYKLKLQKCRFLVKEAEWAGTLVTAQGISIPQQHMESVRTLEPPQTLSDLKSLLGFCSFLRCHVPYYCDVTHDLQELLKLKESKRFNLRSKWTACHQLAFDTIKKLLCQNQILAFPDSAKPYVLYTDASKRAMSAVLMQVDSEGQLKPISYWSKSFKGSQKSWSALVKEARAVYEAVQHYAVFLTGVHVVLRCDHKPLARFLEARTKNEMVNRWSLAIQEFLITFEWVASEQNISDCLSRMGASNLFHDHTDVESDFPAFPKSATPVDTGSQVSVVALSADTARHVFDAASTLDEKDEAKLLGILEDLKITDFARLSTEQVKYMQQHDNYCSRIMSRLPTFTGANGKFQVVDGLLYKHALNDVAGKERLASLALVVPKGLTLSILINLHKELNHPGRDKMLAVLRTRVYWKKLSSQVAEFVAGCRICQHRHLKNAVYRQMRIKPPRGPGIRLAIDCWSGGGCTALTAIDLHSSYPFAEPIPDKRAQSVCNALQNILSYMRKPLEILSDNGPEFVNETFKQLMTERDIKHRTVAPHSPESNGIIERFHGYLNSVFRTTVNFSTNASWWPAVRSAVETYRKIPHTASGEAPMFLFMAQEPTYSIDSLLPTLSREVWDPDSNQLDLQQLRAAYALARKNLCLARRKAKSTAKLTFHRKLQVGDRVYKQNQTPKSKVDLKWEPGFRIVGFESSRTAIVEHTETAIKSRVNVRQLRWADPVSELINNSCLDTFPGRSRLYFTSEDLEDLNWDAIEGLPPLDPTTDEMARQITRDRSTDLTEQPPIKRAKLDVTPKAGETERRKSGRMRTRSSKLKEYVVGLSFAFEVLEI